MAATERAIELAVAAARAASDIKAEEIIALDVSEQLVLTDVFLIASGTNERQVGAIVDAVEEKMRAAGTRPPRREGEREGRWVLLDFVDVVVHIQHSEERVFYALDRLWKDCPTIPWVDASGDPTAAASTDDTDTSDADETVGEADTGLPDPERADVVAP